MSEQETPRRLRFVHREQSENYVLAVLLSFACSVGLTRLFLTLTGYPQIGGGEIHIAHVLWGGLLLFAAAIAPLVLANRWIFSLSAILAGAGVGLFIDEVGKFITTRNDYFYPAAAPIVYVLFLLVVLLYIRIHHLPDTGPDAELHRALGDIRALLEHPFKPLEHGRLQSRLGLVAGHSNSQNQIDLADSLLRFVQATSPKPPPTSRGPTWRPDLAAASRILQPEAPSNSRRLLAIGLLTVGMMTLKNPAGIWFSPWLPQDLSRVLGAVSGRHFDPALSPLWSNVRISLEVVLGSVLTISSALLALKRVRLGSALALVALMLCLSTLNIILYYFEQFSTIIITTLQFGLLIALLEFREPFGDIGNRMF